MAETGRGARPLKRYLGDGVYAAIDEWGRLVITAENGISATDTIVFEPEVFIELERYVKDAIALAKAKP